MNAHYFVNVMKTAILISVLVFNCALGQSSNKTSPSCKSPRNAKSCYWVHGRLTYGNGTPAVRLWKVGTHRLLGIYSGPEVDRRSLDNENPRLPGNVQDVFGPYHSIFADFEVCPLEPEEPGTMQAACIHAARNIHPLR
jgi:hypothetical protein